MCEAFIRKIGRDTTSVVLKISSLKKYYNDSFNITINYGKWEEYSSGIPFYSTLMGIALCLPNIIIHILNLYKYHSSYGNFLLRDIKEDMITDINDEDEVIRVNNYKPYLYSAYNYDGKISIESHNFGGGYMYELQPMMWITE